MQPLVPKWEFEYKSFAAAVDSKGLSYSCSITRLGLFDLFLQCTDRQERDRLVLFIDKLLFVRRNVKELLDANGIRVLVDLLTLAHMHTTRATVPTQVINNLSFKIIYKYSRVS